MLHYFDCKSLSNGHHSIHYVGNRPATLTGYPRHRENREIGQKNPSGNLEILPKHRELGLLKF